MHSDQLEGGCTHNSSGVAVYENRVNVLYGLRRRSSDKSTHICSCKGVGGRGQFSTSEDSKQSRRV